VITPYKQQYNELKKLLSRPDSEKIKDNLEINTVDRFQGREKDIIIFSCVRAHSGGIGFLADIRRMNVALTRARFSLLVIGHSPSLCTNPHWDALVNDAKQRNCYISVGQDFYEKNPSRVDLTLYMPIFAQASPSKQNTLRKSSSSFSSPPLKTSSSHSLLLPVKTSASLTNPLKTPAGGSPADTPSPLKKSPSMQKPETKNTSAKRPLGADVTVDVPSKKLKNDSLTTPITKPTISKPQTNLNTPTPTFPLPTSNKTSAENLTTTNNTSDNSSELTNSGGIKGKKSYNPGKRQTIMLTSPLPTKR